jgi:hypothetical protein
MPRRVHISELGPTENRGARNEGAKLVARIGGVAWKGAAELTVAPDEREC